MAYPGPIAVLTELPMREARLIEKNGEEFRVVYVDGIFDIFSVFKMNTITISVVPDHLKWTGAQYVVR